MFTPTNILLANVAAADISLAIVVSNAFNYWPFWYKHFSRNSGLHLQVLYWILSNVCNCSGDVPKFDGFSGGEIPCDRQTL